MGKRQGKVGGRPGSGKPLKLNDIAHQGEAFYKLGFIARRRAEQGDSAGAQGRAQGPPKAEPGLPGGGEAITRRAAAAA